MIRLIFPAVIWITFAFTAQAAEMPYLYQGIRPLGMGGAFIAVSDDDNALFYNPAGLALVRRTRVALFPLEFAIGKDGYDMFDDARSVDFDNEMETAAFLQKYVGQQAHLSTSLLATYSMPRTACALLAGLKANLAVHDRQFPRLGTDIVMDMGAAAGYGRPLSYDENLLGGISIKYIDRHSIDRNYTVADITTGKLSQKIEDDMDSGRGVLMDLGLIYRLSDLMDPWTATGIKLGLTAANLGDTKLGDARDLDDHIDIGIALSREIWMARLTLAIDYVDLFRQLDGENDFAKRTRIGVEYRLPHYLTLRAGLYQGYLSGGLSLQTAKAVLDLAIYTAEMGAYGGQHPDRRFTMRFVLGF